MLKEIYSLRLFHILSETFNNPAFLFITPVFVKKMNGYGTVVSFGIFSLSSGLFYFVKHKQKQAKLPLPA
jgi:hypothetical protein